MSGDLADKMLALAKDHPRGEELRTKAEALIAACAPEVPAPKLLGAWARARKLWCEVTGGPLV